MADNPFSNIPKARASDNPFADLPKSGNAFVDVSAAPQQEPLMPLDEMAMQYGQAAKVEPSTMPYQKQMGRVGEVVRGGVRGVPAGIPGIVGEAEALGRAGARYLGADIEQEPFFPTTEFYASKLYGAPEAGTRREKTEKLGVGVGSLFSPIGVPLKGASKTAQAAGEFFIGRPSIRAAKVAAEAEKEGLPVLASQVKGRSPRGEPLSLKNQEKINEEVSSVTGKETKSITPEFVQERLKTLGKDYDKIYDRKINIDESVAAAAKSIAEQERSLGAAGDPGIASIASNISNRFDAAQAAAKQQQVMQIISGQQTAMKRGKAGLGEFVERKFGPNERIDAVPLTQDLLRYYGAGDHTNVRPITAPDAPAWAADVNNAITELVDKLGLRVRPGIYVGNGAGSYGWAHPYGHIFLNETILPKSKDAIATALHEFGHMVEFQLFEQAPKELKAEINRAWSDSKIAGQGKTVEQLRPITSEKYGPEHAQMIPQSPRDKEYYLGFKEWFAEQVSRFLTTAEKPVTVVDKFFKGIADAWKAIYAKVTGHMPMADATEKFMRMNWEGKLINENAVQRVFQLPEGKAVAGAAPEAPAFAKEAALTTIDGKDFQRLRSYIANKAANHPDGNIRFQARQLLTQIDGAIEKTNKNIAKQLQQTNRKYRATLTLRELQKAGDESLNAGNVSPQAIGRVIQAEGSELTHPFSKFGEYGNVLKMRSATQGAEVSPDILRNLLSRSGRVIRFLGGPLTPLVQTTRRGIQRRMKPGAPPPVSDYTGAAAVAAPARAAPTSEEDR